MYSDSEYLSNLRQRDKRALPGHITGMKMVAIGIAVVFGIFVAGALVGALLTTIHTPQVVCK